MQRVKSVLNEVFKKTGKNKVDACKVMNISRETLWRWTKDISKASLGDLIVLSEFLGCEITDLFVKECVS